MNETSNLEGYTLINDYLLESIRHTPNLKMGRVRLEFKTIPTEKLSTLRLLGGDTINNFDDIYYMVKDNIATVYSDKGFMMRSYNAGLVNTFYEMDFTDVDLSQCTEFKISRHLLQTVILKNNDIRQIKTGYSNLLSSIDLKNIVIDNVQFNPEASAEGMISGAITGAPGFNTKVYINNPIGLDKHKIISNASLGSLRLLNFDYDCTVISNCGIQNAVIDTFSIAARISHSDITYLRINNYASVDLFWTFLHTFCHVLVIDNLNMIKSDTVEEHTINSSGYVEIDRIKINHADFNNKNNLSIFDGVMCDKVDISTCKIDNKTKSRLFFACKIQTLQVSRGQYDIVMNMINKQSNKTVSNVEIVEGIYE